jgi:hypothetical protein
MLWGSVGLGVVAIARIEHEVAEAAHAAVRAEYAAESVRVAVGQFGAATLEPSRPVLLVGAFEVCDQDVNVCYQAGDRIGRRWVSIAGTADPIAGSRGLVGEEVS